MSKLAGEPASPLPENKMTVKDLQHTTAMTDLPLGQDMPRHLSISHRFHIAGPMYKILHTQSTAKVVREVHRASHRVCAPLRILKRTDALMSGKRARTCRRQDRQPALQNPSLVCKAVRSLARLTHPAQGVSKHLATAASQKQPSQREHAWRMCIAKPPQTRAGTPAWITKQAELPLVRSSALQLAILGWRVAAAPNHQ